MPGFQFRVLFVEDDDAFGDPTILDEEEIFDGVPMMEEQDMSDGSAIMEDQDMVGGPVLMEERAIDGPVSMEGQEAFGSSLFMEDQEALGSPSFTDDQEALGSPLFMEDQQAFGSRVFTEDQESFVMEDLDAVAGPTIMEDQEAFDDPAITGNQKAFGVVYKVPLSKRNEVASSSPSARWVAKQGCQNKVRKKIGNEFKLARVRRGLQEQEPSSSPSLRWLAKQTQELAAAAEVEIPQEPTPFRFLDLDKNLRDMIYKRWHAEFMGLPEYHTINLSTPTRQLAELFACKQMLMEYGEFIFVNQLFILFSFRSQVDTLVRRIGPTNVKRIAENKRAGVFDEETFECYNMLESGQIQRHVLPHGVNYRTFLSVPNTDMGKAMRSAIDNGHSGKWLWRHRIYPFGPILQRF